MVKWAIKKWICGKVNDGLRNATVDAAKTTVRIWLARLQAIAACLSAILERLDDGKLDPEEIDSGISDAEKLIREW